MKQFCLLLAFTFLFVPIGALAQKGLTYAPESTIVVDGASNQSDWKVNALEFSGVVSLESGAPISATLVIPVLGMKGGRSMIMDRLMRGAFKADENPNISFTMSKADAVDAQTFDVHGTLTMAGVSNPVTIRLIRSKNSAGNFVFAGSLNLDMKEYKMDPPSAMFGALLTKPNVKIGFNLILN
ncbi:MAG: YceI family protein [Bacteroidetes bacterium]|nr:YceI family protein [Bacteroidota bacterium]